jgi:hypothetical protein
LGDRGERKELVELLTSGRDVERRPAQVLVRAAF